MRQFSRNRIAGCKAADFCNCKLRNPAPTPDERDGGFGILPAPNNRMKTTWITVALFDDLQAGKKLEAFLRDKRIDARTYNDKLLQLFLFLCPPQATFRVQVRQPFYKMTIELLNAEVPTALEKAIHCPDCGSLRINYPQMTRKFFLPTLFLHLGIIFRLIKHQAYCENCHFVWSLAKAQSTDWHEAVRHP
jgi:hypothetical protein